LKEELRRKRKEDPLSVITEWEKGRLKKLFKAYDKEKKALIKMEDLKSLYKDLI
jgi:Ca2+-binding EF-hand superfamily protein